MVLRIHSLSVQDDDPYFAAQSIIEKYYKFLGFCYICFSFWAGLIFSCIYFTNIKEIFLYTGLLSLTNFILRKWTI